MKQKYNINHLNHYRCSLLALFVAHHVALRWKIIISIILLCNASVVFAVPPASYDLEDIRHGVTKSEAIKKFEKQGYKLVQEEVPDRRVTIRDKISNEHLGSLYFCNDKLFANSVGIIGGISAMIRRASQFNTTYGQAKMEASSKINDISEVNTLSFSWSHSVGEITLEFTPKNSWLNESQFITFSVPSVCK